MPTPFDDLRCIDCEHLWSEHHCTLDEPGLLFVIDNETAEDLRKYLIALAAKVESLRAELSGLRTYLTRSIAADIDGLDEVSDILEGLPAEDTATVGRWIEAMREPAYWSKDIASLKAENEELRAELEKTRNDIDVELRHLGDGFLKQWSEG